MDENTFVERFSTEEKCREYICETKWKNGFRCPHCGQTEKWVDGEKYKCKHCGRKTSLRTGTIFEKSHIPLVTWFNCLLDVSKALDKGKVTTKAFRKRLGMCSKSTPLLVLDKIVAVIEKVKPKKEEGIFGVASVDVRIGRQIKSLLVAIEVINKNTGLMYADITTKFSPDEFIRFIEQNVVAESKLAFSVFPMLYQRLKDNQSFEIEKGRDKKNPNIKKYKPGHNDNAVEEAERMAEFLKKKYTQSAFVTVETATQAIKAYCSKQNEKIVYFPTTPITFEDLLEAAVLFNPPNTEK